MHFNDVDILEVLLAGNLINLEDAEEARLWAGQNHAPVASYFIQNDILTKNDMGKAVADYYNIVYADLDSRKPPAIQVRKIPEEIGLKYRAVLFDDGIEMVVASDFPAAEGFYEALEEAFPDRRIRLAYALSDEVDAALIHYRKPLDTRFSRIIEENTRVAPNILEEVFKDAITFRASDIHFEPLRETVVVRFRVDGVLREAGRIPFEHYENILNRIKVQSGLRIDRHRQAQDGSLQYLWKQNRYDMRISIIPTVRGEKIVTRVLSSYIEGLTLNNLGLNEKDQITLQAAAKKPFGMIIVSGPTGSGKTTSLYALLRMLNTPEVNITTIEDPVEYKVEGINQVQMNRQTDLTFAKGLRSIVRQDPDIILVGEIRDEETAEIAVNAALTGHLMLSSFHANDAATTIPRLLDMNVEPFLLSSTLELILSQRLVRKIHDDCKETYTLKKADLEKMHTGLSKYFPGVSTEVYRGAGCAECNHSGYEGRTAIFEMIPITRKMRELILENPSTQEVWRLAKKDGAISLFEDGVKKVKEGVTTIDELLRVSEPPYYEEKS